MAGVKKVIYIIGSLAFWVVIIIGIYHGYPDKLSLDKTSSDTQRNLLPIDCYPKRTEYEFVIFFIFGVIYMFIALSIIVDDFFVPSLVCKIYRNTIFILFTNIYSQIYT